MDNNDAMDKQSSSKGPEGRTSDKKVNKPAADDNDSRSNYSGSNCSYRSKQTNRSNESGRKSDPMFLLNPEVNERNEEVVLKKRRFRRNPGKVQKRRPKPRRRHVVRKPVARKTRIYRDEDDDGSLTSSRQSMIYCLHCGNRCYRRRVVYYWDHPKLRRRRQGKKYNKRVRKNRRRAPLKRVQKRRTKGQNVNLTPKWARSRRRRIANSAAIQVGSTCPLLSPLCVNAYLEAANKVEEITYHEITPQMIHQAMRELSMWRQNVPTDLLMECLLENNNLNPNIEELWVELNDKLVVAAIVGIVRKVSDNLWTMTSAQQRKRHVLNSHVTLFWKVYMDPMRPVNKKPVTQNHRTEETESEGESNLKRIYRDYEIL